MKLKGIRVAVALTATLGLMGCIAVGPEDPIPEDQRLKARVVPPRSVALDARGFGAEEYDWDLGDGTVKLNAGSIVSHTYDEPGRYVVIVVARGEGIAPGDDGDIGGPSVGQCPPGGETGEESSDSEYVVVDLIDNDSCAATIIAFREGKPSTSYWLWDAPVFWGGMSSTGDHGTVWYGWVAERVYRQWVPGEGSSPGSWSGPWVREQTGQHTGEYWNPGHNFFKVPVESSAGESPDPLYYDITLFVNDQYGRSCNTTLRIRVHNLCK